jgi:DNA-binding IclR family transcriptional regulator
MSKPLNLRVYSTPALDKGLDILELFATSPTGLTVTEVASALNRSIGEIFRMLLCLEQRGYLSHSGLRERYHLTLRLFCQGLKHPPTDRLINEALPIMECVSNQLKQSCHIGVIDGRHVVILAQVDAPESMGFHVKMGSRVDLHAATGHVIMAHQNDGACQRVLQQWSRETRREIPIGLNDRLMKIRQRGYESRASSEVKGIVNISFPVLSPQGHAAAGLTVPYLKRPDNGVGITDVVDVLRVASRRISQAVGAR